MFGSFLECVVISWIYGTKWIENVSFNERGKIEREKISSSYCSSKVNNFVGAERFIRDIELMTGRRIPLAMRISWSIVAPLIMMVR
jgi:hypothetical protein